MPPNYLHCEYHITDLQSVADTHPTGPVGAGIETPIRHVSRLEWVFKLKCNAKTRETWCACFRPTPPVCRRRSHLAVYTAGLGDRFPVNGLGSWGRCPACCKKKTKKLQFLHLHLSNIVSLHPRLINEIVYPLDINRSAFPLRSSTIVVPNSVCGM